MDQRVWVFTELSSCGGYTRRQWASSAAVAVVLHAPSHAVAHAALHCLVTEELACMSLHLWSHGSCVKVLQAVHGSPVVDIFAKMLRR